jgi:hypothetical protein
LTQRSYDTQIRKSSKMKLFDFKKREDYGTDYYFSFLKTKKHTALQLSVSYCEYDASWPYMQISIGMGKVFGVFCYFWKFGFDFDILGNTWWL